MRGRHVERILYAGIPLALVLSWAGSRCVQPHTGSLGRYHASLAALFLTLQLLRNNHILMGKMYNLQRIA
jgi:hypothetical protein